VLKRGRRKIPHNNPAREGRSGSTCSATRSGKACKSSSGRKTPQESGEDPPPMCTVNKHAACSVTSPSVLGKGKACSSGIAHRRTLSKQSLQGQESVKLTPEICINKASSNSRLTEVGR
jgi:hypothetical protein